MRLGWIILLVIVATSLATEIPEIIQGFIDGFGIDQPLDDTMKCVDPKSMEEWEGVIKEIKDTKNWTNLNKAKVTNTLVKVCMKRFTEMYMCPGKELIDFVNKINWEDKIKSMRKNIEKKIEEKEETKDIKKMFEELVKLWDKENYYKVGEVSGEFLGSCFKKSEET